MKDERTKINFQQSGYYSMIFSSLLCIIGMGVTIRIDGGPKLAFFSIVTIYISQQLFWIISNIVLMKTKMSPVSILILFTTIVFPIIGLVILITTGYLSLFILSLIFSCIAAIHFLYNQKKTQY